MSDQIEKVDDERHEIECIKLYYRIIKSLMLGSIKYDDYMSIYMAVITKLIIEAWNDKGGCVHGLIKWIEDNYDFYTDKDEDSEEKTYPPKPKYLA